MTVAVTGSSGFIGQHVRAIGRTFGIAIRPIPRAAASDAIAPLLEGAVAVVHLAGLAHAHGRVPSEDEFLRANASYAGIIADAARRAKVKRFVFVSTIKVNGETTTDRPFSVEDLPNPHDAYGRSKLAGEQLVTHVAESAGIEAVIVRPPMVVGPDSRTNFARLVRLVQLGVPLPFASVKNKRTLIGADNLAEFLLLCATHRAAAGRTFLIGDEPSISTPDLLRLIGAGIGRPVSLFSAPPGALRSIARAFRRGEEMEKLTGSLEIDSSSAQRLLGWTPRFPLEETLSRAASEVARRR